MPEAKQPTAYTHMQVLWRRARHLQDRIKRSTRADLDYDRKELDALLFSLRSLQAIYPGFDPSRPPPETKPADGR